MIDTWILLTVLLAWAATSFLVGVLVGLVWIAMAKIFRWWD